MNPVLSPADVKGLPVVGETELLVAGGGPAGVTAAIEAASCGVKTWLVEAAGYLGGSRTLTAVDTFYGFFSPGNEPLRVVGGLPWRIASAIVEDGDAFYRPNTYGAGTGITYDVEALKRLLDRMALEAGVDLAYHSLVGEIVMEDGRMSEVVLSSKQGRLRVRCESIIDCTGDADLAAMAGAPFEMAGRKGRPIQSLTTIFFMVNVDEEAASKVTHSDLVTLMQEANAGGRFELPREDGSIHRTPHRGVMQANMVRIPRVDPTSVEQITKGEIEGRRQAAEYARFLREMVPGFERASLFATSHHIGVRESRRIIGEYVLTEEDVLGGAQFADQIGLCAAPIEDHHAGSDTRWVYVGGPGFYGLPYRTLVPRDVDWLLVAGRCFSATHGAQASARNSAQAMLTGEAAGRAMAIALTEGIPPRLIDVDRLRKQLLEEGAVLSDPPAAPR